MTAADPRTGVIDRGVRTIQERSRLIGPEATARIWGWVGPLLVTAIGGFLRFWRLDKPHVLVFDETYYVKQGASFLKSGYELSSSDSGTPSPDQLFTKGTWDVFHSNPDFVVHPPVGKWMIAFGEWLFGPTSSWGWRFSVAFCGTLSLLMIARIGRRLFGSTLLGCTAALLLAVDGEHFVMSRTGLLDLFIMFWGLAGFGFLLIDRDQARARLARSVAEGVPQDRWLRPGLGIRWWRFLAAICFGLSAGSKWSGAFFLAVFAVMSVLWDLGARRAVGQRHWLVNGLVRDGGTGFVQMVPLALAAYLAAWTGWFRSSNAWDRQWAAARDAYDTRTHGHPHSSFSWIPASLRSLWHYHAEMWNFNVNLHSPHPYQSNPWSWLVLGRPTAFSYVGFKQGQDGCTVAQCSRAITDIGNPVIWWGGTIAIAVLLFHWALGRDWRAGAILAGLVAGYVPWFHYQSRTIFTFYAVAFVPWVVLSLTYALGLLLGGSQASPQRRLYGAVAAGSVVVLAVMAFAFFYPVYSAVLIPQTSWANRMWMPSWI